MQDFCHMNNSSKNKPAYIIGIAGASGSGKTFISEKISSALGKRVVALSQDFYYKDQTEKSLEQRKGVNYDHPDAVDFDLLVRHLKTLKQGGSVMHPLYDFQVHNRRKTSEIVESAPVILIEGILIYAVPALSSLIDFKVFVDTPADICFIRRLQRDLQERGRSLESVIEQYLATVRPMFVKYVMPSKKQADLVVVGQGDMEPALRYVLKTLPH
jgi:uridine kinase